MSTQALKISKADAIEELKANQRQQEAIVEKFSWIDLDDSDYIEADHRLAECQEREVLLLKTIDLHEQLEEGR